MAERRRWAVYYDETMERNMKRLREETAKKDGVPVGKITNRRVIADVLAEKFVEYADKQNNRARITTIVEQQMETIALLRALEVTVREHLLLLKRWEGE